MTCARTALLATCTAVLGPGGWARPLPAAVAQSDTTGERPAPAPVLREVLHGEPAPWRFAPGERAVYAVTFGPMRVGEGRLAVEALDTVGGTSAYRVSFELEGGPFFYRIDDRQVSWVAPHPLRSLRFDQYLRQGGYRRDRRYFLDPEAGAYTRLDLDRESGAYVVHEEEIAVPIPPGALDEIAFLFLARLLPLEPGRTWRFERYFEPEGNPVIIEVLRRERVRVPAGRFQTVVVRPIIKASGTFGRDGKAELYISDDEHRIIVRLKARMKVGEMEMFLTEYDPGDPAALLPPRPALGSKAASAVSGG